MRSTTAAEGAAEFDEIPLYEKRKEIYQRETDGRFQRLRAATLFVLAGIFFVGPWLQWGDRQAVWWDLPSRKFHLFGMTFWPQDFILLSWLMIIAAFGLFFFTNLAGRLWCGYGCPQTVWTKFYMWIEWLTEGDRNQRIKLDQSPWSATKVRLKAEKHGLWLLLAFVVGTTFVGYFIPIRNLVPRMFTLNISSGETVFLAVASLALYFDAGWMREQICKFACPYARFQGAMFDTNTLTIFYDSKRGEPRGHRRRSDPDSHQVLGDCVDCNLCVQVCPTGIDIRDGIQSECIGCAACIDACDEVMDKLHYPRGLVRYATENTLGGAEYNLFRPRLFGYAAVFVAMIAAFTYGLATRVPLELDIIRERNRLYRETPAGDIENVYRLRVLNMDQRDHTYRIDVGGLDGVKIVGEQQVEVAAGEIRDVPMRLEMPFDALEAGSRKMTFTLSSTDDSGWELTEESRFVVPARR